MTINKAIELLKIASHGWPIGNNEDYYRALDLGIKALERINGLRSAGHYIGMPLLKGEASPPVPAPHKKQ